MHRTQVQGRQHNIVHKQQQRRRRHDDDNDSHTHTPTTTMDKYGGDNDDDKLVDHMTGDLQCKPTQGHKIGGEM